MARIDEKSISILKSFDEGKTRFEISKELDLCLVDVTLTIDKYYYKWIRTQ